ncbi:MAG: ribonuclease HII [Candidatus Levybacteria bacterium]|nr:ribonuclease HII [Candidatus Levybacteria bacterium]
MITPTLFLEKSLWEKGFKNIAGVDEAGRGPWAGPVTAASVVIHSENQIVAGVRDSKKMTKSQREKAYHKICKKSSGYGIGIVSERDIDVLGIQKGVRKAMFLSLENLKANFGIDISLVLVDGGKTLRLYKYKSRRIKKGGLFHYSISAASVLAKVTRDRIMKKLARKYPYYYFSKNVGYGTKAHQEALKKHGISPIHRKSYAPIKKMLRQNKKSDMININLYGNTSVFAIRR